MTKLTKPFFTSSVSPKGQITLPKEFRDQLDIGPKDVVVIALQDGKIQIESAKARLRSVYQSLPALEPPRDWQTVTTEAWDEFAERNARTGLLSPQND